MNTQTKLENTKIMRLDLRQLLTEEQEDWDFFVDFEADLSLLKVSELLYWGFGGLWGEGGGGFG